jgi:hypothetical protein
MAGFFSKIRCLADNGADAENTGTNGGTVNLASLVL